MAAPSTHGAGGLTPLRRRAGAQDCGLALDQSVREQIGQRMGQDGRLQAGFALGLAQQMRGAHFMSHTLWTAWLCWAGSWLCDLISSRNLAAPASAALRPAE